MERDKTGQKLKLLLPMVVVCCGCPGSGNGWIQGSLWIDNCKDGESFGDSAQNRREFDLNVDFFTGEPFEDSNKSVSQRKNSLTLRIQNTSNNVEESDGLLVQINDLDLAAQALAGGTQLPITASQLCPGGNCPLVQDLVRASLYLFTTCPDGSQPLSGSSHEFAPSTDKPDCLFPTGKKPDPCPPLTAATQSSLDQLCEGDFEDRSSFDLIGQLLGGSCMYLCRFGDAKRGQDPNDLDGFVLDYGDRVAAIISLNIVDGRAINLQSCAQVAGEVRGMFDFELTRGQSAQSFP
jgi:hypothetical protein